MLLLFVCFLVCVYFFVCLFKVEQSDLTWSYLDMERDSRQEHGQHGVAYTRNTPQTSPYCLFIASFLVCTAFRLGHAKVTEKEMHERACLPLAESHLARWPVSRTAKSVASSELKADF